MGLSILNNIPSLMAQNELAITNQNLQNTLFQLASGSRINSGADDAAGLSIANGLQANIAALNQSTTNANNAVGDLQTADGALGQVTTLLDRAVTLATEASNSGLTSAQANALNTEYTSIQSEIDRIGSTTTFNGNQVFTNTPVVAFMSDGTTTGTGTPISVTPGTLSSAALNLPEGTAATGTLSAVSQFAAGNTVTIGTTAYRFETSGNLSQTNDVLIGSSAGAAGIAQSLANLQAAINGGSGEGTDYIGTAGVPNNDATATGLTASTLTVTSSVAGTGSAISTSTTAPSGVAWANTTLTGGSVASSALTSTASAQTTLTAINNAIAQVAAQDGAIGAGINQMTAAVNVANVQVQNLTSAEDNVTAADIPTLVANLNKYNILEQTGISALAQANTTQQAVLKLLQ